MNNLKFIIIALLAVGCNDPVPTIKTSEDTTFKAVDAISISNTYILYVIEYEGCKYFTQSRGGILHLQTCTNH